MIDTGLPTQRHSARHHQSITLYGQLLLRRIVPAAHRGTKAGIAGALQRCESSDL